MEEDSIEAPEILSQETIRDFLPKEVDRWLHHEILQFEQVVLVCNEAQQDSIENLRVEADCLIKSVVPKVEVSSIFYGQDNRIWVFCNWIMSSLE